MSSADRSGAVLVLLCLLLFSAVVLPAVRAEEECKTCYNKCFQGDCDGEKGTACDHLCEFNCRGTEFLCSMRNFIEDLFGIKFEEGKQEEQKE